VQSKIRSWRRAIVMRGVSGINGGNWSDVPSEKCGCDECPKVVAVKGADDDFNYMMYHIYRARGHSN